MTMDMKLDTKETRISDKIDYAVGDCHDDTALLRRVDWRILPVMFLTYFLQFLDKVSLNVSFLYRIIMLLSRGYALMMA
jgi:hypothetical protein